jgi:hypothetical protein
MHFHRTKQLEPEHRTLPLHVVSSDVQSWVAAWGVDYGEGDFAGATP